MQKLTLDAQCRDRLRPRGALPERPIRERAQPTVIRRWRNDLVDGVNEAIQRATVVAVHEQETTRAHRFPASERHCLTPIRTDRQAPSWRTSARVSTTDQSSTISPFSNR